MVSTVQTGRTLDPRSTSSQESSVWKAGGLNVPQALTASHREERREGALKKDLWLPRRKGISTRLFLALLK